MKHVGRLLAAAAAAGAVAFGTYTLLANNQRQQGAISALDAGESTVSGYRVTNLHFTTAGGPSYTSVSHHQASARYLASVTFTLAGTTTDTAQPTQVAVSVVNYTAKITTGLTSARRAVGLKPAPGITADLVWSGATLTLAQSRGCLQNTWSTASNSGTFTCHWSAPGSTSDAPFLATADHLDVTASN